MMHPVLARLVVPVLLGLLLTACSSDEEPPAASPSETTSESPSGSAPGEDSCLFTVAETSTVLGGEWEREPAAGDACGYTSDRGATFATKLVDQPIDAGLRSARKACVEGVRPVAVGEGFVCLERQPQQDLVVGNIPSGGELFVVVIVPTSEGIPQAELQAMAALLDSVEG